MGWSLPETSWFGSQLDKASCAGTSYLNWMAAQQVNWWKIPAPIPGSSPPVSAATWMWFDAQSHLPVRLMFGEGPPKPTKGDPGQLALFQMFSFTYFPVFTSLDQPPADPPSWTEPDFRGFTSGNPENFNSSPGTIISG